MPFQFLTLTPYEFEIMRNAKVEMLRLSNPYLVPAEEEKEQSHEEQRMMIETANVLFGGST